jgi:nitroreductase
MNATLDAINHRYACRAFADTPVPPDTLHTIAVAGLHAPSAMNRQPWRIISVSDRTILDDIERIGLAGLRAEDPNGYERIMGRGGRLLYNAPAMIVVAAQKLNGPLKADLDVGIVASHLVLAATSLAVNSVIVALPMFGFRSSEGPALKQRLGFPEGYDYGIGVLFGYAAGQPGTPHEADVAKLIEL